MQVHHNIFVYMAAALMVMYNETICVMAWCSVTSACSCPKVRSSPPTSDCLPELLENTVYTSYQLEYP